MNQNSTTYDIVIIGGGIAGLYLAVNLVKKYKVALAEKYSKFGGRTFTFNADISGTKYQWEEGAARISDSHTMTLSLLKKYGLTMTKIGKEISYKESGLYKMEPNHFESAIPILLKPLYLLSKDTLANSTIRKLLVDIHGEKETDSFLNRYPYRAEINTMRADMALSLFDNEFGKESGYSICNEGLTELINRMKKEFETAGGTVFPHHELINVEGTNAIFKNGPPSKGSSRPTVVLQGKKIVFALPVDSIKQIKPFKNLEPLKHLTMKPLLRIYAVFPNTDWFQYSRIITAQRPRYIIPGDLKKGVIQISYTDSTDTIPLMKMYEEKGESYVGSVIVEDLRTLLGVKVPDPLFVKVHPWKQGVTYWLPGDYDPYKLSKELCKPFPDREWFLAGESYSTRQCWIEGALEHAHMVEKII